MAYRKIYTIGYGKSSFEDFVSILQKFNIKHLVDIRSFPYSRTNKSFNQKELASLLSKANIIYSHLKGLGGRRKAKKDSINTGWNSAGFRGYADYMQTQEFQEALDQLISIARKERTAIMCAESVPWRCHRRLIADALLLHNFKVRELYLNGSEKEHMLTPMAKVKDHQLYYPKE